MGQYPEALEWFQRALNDPGVDTEDGALGPIYSNLGVLYYRLGEYDNAERYGLLGYDHSMRANAIRSAVPSLMNLSNVLCALGRWDEAVERCAQAAAILEESGQTELLSAVDVGLADALLQQNEPDLAKEVIARMKTAHIPMIDIEFRRLIVLGRHSMMTDAPDDAHQRFTAALELAESKVLHHEQADAHQALMELAELKNDLKGYIHHNKRQQEIRESIAGKQASIRVAMVSKEKEIAAERQEAERHKALLYGALPAEIADRMIRGEDVSGDKHENAAVLFLDVVGFTTHSSSMDPHDTTTLLAEIFERFDEICKQHSVTKVKTIGDSFMAVGFEGRR